MSYKLKLNERLESSVRRIGTEQIDSAVARLTGAGDPVEIVHGTRKSLKKIRALLRMARPGLADGVFEQENTRFRDIARQLSQVRDQHVLRDVIAALHGTSDGQVKAAFGAAASQLAATTADAGHADLPTALLKSAAAKLEVARASMSRLEVDDGHQTAFAGITDCYRKARRAMHHGFTTLDAEDLHEFRKHAQHHWRHMQLMSAAWPEYFEARASTARRLSMVLGDDHDLAMVSSHVAEPGSLALTTRRRILILSAVEARQVSHRWEARRLAHQLFADPPRVFCETIARHWATALDAIRHEAAQGKVESEMRARRERASVRRAEAAE